MRRNDNQGVALLTALALLGLFAMLGAAYVAYMSAELEETAYDVGTLRMRHAARGGVRAAMGELQAALDTAGLGPLLEKGLTMTVPVYRPDRHNPQGFSSNTGDHATVQVTLASEEGPGVAAGTRCFRIVSEASAGAASRLSGRARAEAVAAFAAGAAPEIVFWSEVSNQ